MKTKIEDFFVDEAKRAFVSLPKSASFAVPVVSRDSGFVAVASLGQNIAIEFLFDERECDVDCKVAKVVSGQKTDSYAVDKSGALVRVGLADLLRRRGVRDRLFANIEGKPLEEQIRAAISDFTEMLRKYGDDILKDSPSVF